MNAREILAMHVMELFEMHFGFSDEKGVFHYAGDLIKLCVASDSPVSISYIRPRGLHVAGLSVCFSIQVSGCAPYQMDVSKEDSPLYLLDDSELLAITNIFGVMFNDFIKQQSTRAT